MRVLAVDDDDMTLQMLVHALAEAGHDVRTARDGAEALSVLHEDAIRMVISDWLMPGMDGIDLCRAIRAETFPGYVYVILLTKRDRTEDIVAGISAGADDFIIKPFEPAELRVRVRAGERILELESRHVATVALAKLTEWRDPETGLHLERIQRYSRILAQQLATHPDFAGVIDASYIENIYLTSPLHDIGKVGIPDCVLLKPGRLTDHEFQIMKRHTTIGAETLSTAVEQHPGVLYLRLARDIALTHHERYNGTGYPNTLVGEDIPLCGRIVALADVYDALTSKRVYKEAFAHEIAHSIILGERGEHFDPRIVDGFVQVEEGFVETKAQFSEALVGV